MQKLSKLDLPMLRKGGIDERTQRNKWKILLIARTRKQVPGFSSADDFSTKLREPVGEPEFLYIYAFIS